jgi:DNA-binding NarL/FixJ family response regulator
MKVAIIAESAASAETIRHTLRRVPDCVILGYLNARQGSMTPLRGVEPELVIVEDTPNVAANVRKIRALVPAGKVVVVAAGAASERAASAGADAALTLSSNLGLLVQEIFAGNLLFVAPPSARPAALPESLTAREVELLRLVATGTPNAAIAAQLWVTEGTVRVLLAGLFTKLGVSDGAEATHYAQTQGLVEDSLTASDRPYAAVA